MVSPVVCQFVSKTLALSLQNNYFCWHPSTFASFQMDLMSLSLSMRAFECLPLQNFVVVVVVATSAFHLVQYPHKPPKSHTPKIPATSPLALLAFVNCRFIHDKFTDCFCHFCGFQVWRMVSTTRKILWQIKISILSEFVTDNEQIWLCICLFICLFQKTLVCVYHNKASLFEYQTHVRCHPF